MDPVEKEEKEKEVVEEKEEEATPEPPEDLASIFAQTEEVETPPAEEKKEEEKKESETTEEKKPEEEEEKEKGDIPDTGKPSVEAKGDEKSEEKAPEAEKGDKVDWEKRYKNTQESYKQRAIEIKGVSSELSRSKAEVTHLTEQLETMHKEVFPGKEMPKMKEPETDSKDDAYATRVRESEELVMTVHSDYREVVGDKDSKDSPYLKAVAEDPSLWSRVRGATNPALEAYRIGKTFLEQEKYGKTPEEMKEKIREEVKAEIAAELATKKEPKKPERKKVTTLRDVDDKGTGSMPPAQESLSAILGGR